MEIAGPAKASAELFAEAMRQRGYRVFVIPGHATVGVNVWQNPEDRYPVDTVWFYDGSPGVTWGPKFEHNTNAGDPNLVDLVIETL